MTKNLHVVGEISDTESENSEIETGSDKDWVLVWKEVKKVTGLYYVDRQ